jgi:hypothetical protein
VPETLSDMRHHHFHGNNIKSPLFIGLYTPYDLTQADWVELLAYKDRQSHFLCKLQVCVVSMYVYRPKGQQMLCFYSTPPICQPTS